MDFVLFLRLATQLEPLERRRIETVLGVEHGARSGIWAAGGDRGDATEVVLHIHQNAPSLVFVSERLCVDRIHPEDCVC
jgi:hypothetical protein